MRIFLVFLAASLALGGCSAVTSDRPLFAAADADGAPMLRPGLWSMSSSRDCDLDAKAPVAEWPKCANPTLVTATSFSDAGSATDSTRPPLNYRLAGKDPSVVQILRPESEKEGPPVVYAGMRVTRRDDEGRATVLRVWLALCAKPLTAGGDLTAKTTKLLPGLTRRSGEGEMECVATARRAVRNSVKQSEIWLAGEGDKDLAMDARWIRDADR